MKKFAAVVVASGALLLPGAALAHGHGHGSNGAGYTKYVSSVKDTGASRSGTPTKLGSSPSTHSTSPGSTAAPTNTVSSVDSANATRSASTASSELPFTGIDIIPLAAGGALLLGAGLFVRRLSSEG